MLRREDKRQNIEYRIQESEDRIQNIFYSDLVVRITNNLRIGFQQLAELFNQTV